MDKAAKLVKREKKSVKSAAALQDAVSNIFTDAASFLSTETHNPATSSILARDEQHLVETSHIRTPSDIIALQKLSQGKQCRREEQNSQQY
ncbi:hypothetical protein EB796_009434 [Bugula neritina]|uniref:Uncharacterized protein n=1 Tax=Bugula neritina TaxID=10212 RepID=A0A7J7K230_BUGNE|nr:hypothetical protein EB796_009434 [Bugula neritina]